MNLSNVHGGSVLTGELISVEIAVGTDRRPVRFFEPRGLLDAPGIGDRDSDIYFRYVELEPGEQYDLSIRLNNPSERYQCSIGVDGLSISDSAPVPCFDDAPWSYRWDHTTNYVFNPDGENGGTVKGWRSFKQPLIPFVAEGTQKSHAVRMFHDTSAVGSIVIAVFRESKDPNAALHQRPPLAGDDEYVADIASSMTLVDDFVASGCAYEVFVFRYAPLAVIEQLSNPVSMSVLPEAVLV